MRRADAVPAVAISCVPGALAPFASVRVDRAITLSHAAGIPTRFGPEVRNPVGSDGEVERAKAPTPAYAAWPEELRALGALGDPVAIKILSALSARDRSGHDLVVESDLPQSSVYRKVRELEEAGLVYVPRLAFTPEGRKVEIFRIRVREVRVEFARGRARVAIIRRDDAADRIHEMWSEVRRT